MTGEAIKVEPGPVFPLKSKILASNFDYG